MKTMTENSARTIEFCADELVRRRNAGEDLQVPDAEELFREIAKNYEDGHWRRHALRSLHLICTFNLRGDGPC